MITQQKIIEHYPDIDPKHAEVIAKNATRAGIQSIEVFTKTMNIVGETAKQTLKALQKLSKAIRGYNACLQVATPKELHLLHHAKRKRTRKKYLNRLIRRCEKINKGGKA